MSLLECRCRLRYPSGFDLDVAFTSEAQVTALFGPSGSGKTTVLSVLAGLRRPDEGLVRLGPRLLFDSAAGLSLPPEARHIGYVFQDHLLFPHLNVRRNLLYGWKRRPAGARPVELETLVKVLDLQGVLDRMPHTLSGGQRQRVALGRALLCGPELLLLDEPLAFLDEALKRRVLDYVGQVLREGHQPTLFVSHDAAEVRRFAQWAVVLREGRVVALGPPEEVLDEGRPGD